jgi:hypothetical protein
VISIVVEVDGIRDSAGGDFGVATGFGMTVDATQLDLR